MVQVELGQTLHYTDIPHGKIFPFASRTFPGAPRFGILNITWIGYTRATVLSCPLMADICSTASLTHAFASGRRWRW